MKTLRTSIGWIALAALSACATPKKQGNVQVSGTFENPTGDMVYLYAIQSNRMQVADSGEVKSDGSYEMITTITGKDFYRFGFDERNSCLLTLQPGDTFQVNASAAAIESTHTIQGSKESEALSELMRKQIYYLTKLDSLQKVGQRSMQAQDINTFMRANAENQAVQQEFQDAIRAFIDAHPNSMANLIAVEQLNKDQDFAYYVRVAEDLQPELSAHPMYQSLAARVANWQKLAEGAVAPNLSYPDPEGNMVELASLRGKYVLIDFWASWCKPCRQENPNVVRMYNKYKDRGFEIYGVSLDQKKNAWINAIQADGLTWPQVSDLNGWSAAPARIYEVTAIPATYLLDPEGRIIAKNLRGQALEQKLEELLG